MRHLILGISGLLGFITMAVCVLKDVSFFTTLIRAGLVMTVSLVVGFIGISFVMLFGYLGFERTDQMESMSKEDLSP